MIYILIASLIIIGTLSYKLSKRCKHDYEWFVKESRIYRHIHLSTFYARIVLMGVCKNCKEIIYKKFETTPSGREQQVLEDLKNLESILRKTYNIKD